MARPSLPDRAGLRSHVGAFVPGDDLSLRRTIDRDGDGNADEALPSGATITRAWLTVKTSQAGLDEAALVQKEITTTNVVGTGQIEDDGTGDVDPVLRFDLVPDDTLAIGALDATKANPWASAPYYDVQVLTSGGKVYTAEAGRIAGQTKQITIDAS